MKRKTSWLLVLGLVLSVTLGVLGWTTLSVQAHTTKPVEQAWTQPPVVQAQLPSAPPATEQVDGKPSNPELTPPPPQSGGDASLCFSCGGNWPIFAGSFPLPSGSSVTERGSACSGDLSSRTDTRPFLCTN